MKNRMQTLVIGVFVTYLLVLSYAFYIFICYDIYFGEWDDVKRGNVTSVPI